MAYSRLGELVEMVAFLCLRAVSKCIALDLCEFFIFLFLFSYIQFGRFLNASSLFQDGGWRRLINLGVMIMAQTRCYSFLYY